MADKEWTVMFYFASDNALSPLIVSQLKAIKDAGFHEDVDVLVHFDSNEAGVPTRVFDVNSRRKDAARREGRRSMIGDGRDSFVRNLIADEVPPDRIEGSAGSHSARLRAALLRERTSNADEALANFLGFCREHHRAKNYMLILCGHGLVVGNDAFLPDENPVSAITLEQLGTTLKKFTDGIKEDKSEEAPEGGVLQLLALHSCAMSAIEVAYQLRGTAKFMLGSEGISYVGSWPYRQMLKRIFNFVERGKSGLRRRGDDRADGGKEGADRKNDPRFLIDRLYFHSLFNAADFMHSGYSLDLCLCNLDSDKFDPLTEAIRPLVRMMRRALGSERGKELILLAHLESQSYWDESYTDLFDFCFCLRKRCYFALDLLGEYGDEKKAAEIRKELEELASVCTGVMEQLDRNRSRGRFEERFDKIVVHACHFGSEYQYSHGLSIYFPWSRPLDDDPPANVPPQLQLRQTEPGRNAHGILTRYEAYAFNRELGKKDEGESWLAFLKSYFRDTEREPRFRELKPEGVEDDDAVGFIPPGVFNTFGGQSDNPFPALSNDKPSPSTGASCACPSIKNYPTVTVRMGGDRESHVTAATASHIVKRHLERGE